MPYANIYWVKLKLELLNDKRFIFDLNDEQKWLFIGLILLAGNTKNSTPADENYLKNRLNLLQTPEKVRENLDFILKTFPKTVYSNGVIKFKNFSKLHNPLKDTLWKSNGTPKDSKNRVEKNRIERIREEYIKVAELNINDFTPNTFARTAKAITTLINKAGNDDLVITALHWIATEAAGKWSWTLETLVNKWPDFMKINNTPDILKKWGKK